MSFSSNFTKYHILDLYYKIWTQYSKNLIYLQKSQNKFKKQKKIFISKTQKYVSF